jgi:hypothetical protein
MREDTRFVNLIQQIATSVGYNNPHALARDARITYRIVRRLYNEPYIKPTTPIGTLDALAVTLGVTVDDLYKRELIPQE